MDLEARSIKQWIREVSLSGPSNREVVPVPIAVKGYKDPQGVKAERAALGAIVSARIQTRAEDILEPGRATLQRPSLQDVKHSGQKYGDPTLNLYTKAYIVRKRLIEAFEDISGELAIKLIV